LRKGLQIHIAATADEYKLNKLLTLTKKAEFETCKC